MLIADPCLPPLLTWVRDARPDAVQAIVHHGDHEGRELVQVVIRRVFQVGVVLVGMVDERLSAAAVYACRSRV